MCSGVVLLTLPEAVTQVDCSAGLDGLALTQACTSAAGLLGSAPFDPMVSMSTAVAVHINVQHTCLLVLLRGATEVRQHAAHCHQPIAAIWRLDA